MKSFLSTTADSTFRRLLTGVAFLIVAVVVLIFTTLVFSSWLPIRKWGLGFLLTSTWDPVNGQFGALPFIVGTVITSVCAILFSLPFSLAIALFLGEYHPHGKVASVFRTLVELMAGIPSVIYGFWALMFLVPMVRSLQSLINYPPYGVGILSASLILSIMVIPFTTSISREVISMVPYTLKDAAFSLGATRFEVITKIIIPYARSGIVAGIFLALGRALGETMAVTMVIGNRNQLPRDLLSPANTMASLIANEFSEATGSLHVGSLMEIALILLLITMVTNTVGRLIVRRFSRESHGKKMKNSLQESV